MYLLQDLTGIIITERLKLKNNCNEVRISGACSVPVTESKYCAVNCTEAPVCLPEGYFIELSTQSQAKLKI